MPPRTKFSGGFTLIEAMIALLVLSVGLLALAMVQVVSLQSNTDAYYRTQAALYAYEIMDRMRANPDAAASGAYQVTDAVAVSAKRDAYAGCEVSTCGCNVAGVVCDSANLALYDLGKWYDDMENGLPAAATPSTITRNGNEYTIVIRWTERELSLQQEWVIEL